MRRMYQRLERCLYMPSGTAGHGFNGYLSVSQEDPSWVNQASDARTLAELAAGATGGSASQLMTLMRRDMNALDPNRDTTIGIFGGTRHADNAGTRSSPNTYIRATLNDAARFPLTVQVNSLVTKVLFSNDSTPTAIGVEYLRGTSLYGADPRSSANNQGTTAQAFASREVIIAGGVFNSPQILKLSGIGPRAELEQFNIPVVVDLPGVGNNMGDNYEDGIIGRFSRSPGFGGTTTNFLKTANSPNGLRNIYMFCGGFAFEGYWPGFPNNYGTGTYGCSLVHMYPRSQKGTVTLRSANPRDMPEINFRFYQENAAQDLQDLYEAVTWVRQNMLTRLSGNTFTEIHPCENSGCSEASQKEYLRLQTYSHHATSSCKIGADNDPQAVLDGQFRVRGVRRLRVVDGSAFPAVPGAFPVISTFMLAEKATDDILRDVTANPSSSSSISSVSSTTTSRPTTSTTTTTPTTTSRPSTTTTTTSRPPTTTATVS
jgi:choline dehydrogenase